MTDKASMADLMAMGVSMAIDTCGGAHVPYCEGRIDATEADPSGVCEPETDIKTTLSTFSGAGFNQADTIALMSCGHTMGGVHHSTFPQIVGPETVSANNLDGGHAFDDTVSTYGINNV
ncbi:hypothetical protein N7G274_004886 [Stereocaulon virgatum]|uniref:Peroxidase n=1 Tax=Stereocaulon virgatum TaxID=373712 RepID=A0ABR4A9G0_9LECA